MTTARNEKTAVSSPLLLVVLALGVAGLLVPLGLRVFVLEAFKIPAGSMFPTLEIGDHVFVTKYRGGSAERGSVIVFEYPDPNPSNPRQDFVKRAIALPGDVLTVGEDGQLSINGFAVPRCRLGTADIPDGTDSYPEELFVEFLHGQAYLVAQEAFRERSSGGPYTVPSGEVYVLGDNRDNSSDSRVWRRGRGAGVPMKNIKGPARWIWLPTSRLGITLDGPPVLPSSAASLSGALEDCLARAPAPKDTEPPRPR